MARIAVIGEPVRVQGFGLAGALVLPAGEPAAVRAAWRSLPGDVEVVILTPAAADALAADALAADAPGEPGVRGAAPGERGAPGGRLTVVLP